MGRAGRLPQPFTGFLARLKTSFDVWAFVGQEFWPCPLLCSSTAAAVACPC